MARYLVAGAREAKINSTVGVFLLIKFEHPDEPAWPGRSARLCAQLSAASWSPGENPVLFLSRDTLGLEGGIFGV